jgi:hypothetical protein
MRYLALDFFENAKKIYLKTGPKIPRFAYLQLRLTCAESNLSDDCLRANTADRKRKSPSLSKRRWGPKFSTKKP